MVVVRVPDEELVSEIRAVIEHPARGQQGPAPTRREINRSAHIKWNERDFNAIIKSFAKE